MTVRVLLLRWIGEATRCCGRREEEPSCRVDDDEWLQGVYYERRNSGHAKEIVQ
jgi:hypothetical protein